MGRAATGSWIRRHEIASAVRERTATWCERVATHPRTRRFLLTLSRLGESWRVRIRPVFVQIWVEVREGAVIAWRSRARQAAWSGACHALRRTDDGVHVVGSWCRRAARRGWQIVTRTTPPPVEVQAPVREPEPKCFYRCASCRHESMLLGAKKYDVFHCPECRARLSIVHPERGLTVVSSSRPPTLPPEPETEMAYNSRPAASASSAGEASAAGGGPGKQGKRTANGAGSSRRPSSPSR